jgi:hypothetical protein
MRVIDPDLTAALPSARKRTGLTQRQPALERIGAIGGYLQGRALRR